MCIPNVIWGNVLTLQIAHGNFLILCQMVLLPKIDFLISKQNSTPKLDPTILSSVLALLFLDISSFLYKQTELNNQNK